MPELSALADYGDLCGEGPLWDPTLYSIGQTSPVSASID